MNFITQRRYLLKIDGIIPEQEFTTNSAVPQGSHCGPLLFNVYTADIQDVIYDLTTRMLQYADELKLYKVIHTIEDNRDLQRAVDNLTIWTKRNKLPINVAKTFHVSYCREHDHSLPHTYYSERMQVRNVNEIQDLGVVFDHHLTFRPHLDRTLASANRLTAMAIRFANEIKYPMIAFVMFNVYISPII